MKLDQFCVRNYKPMRSKKYLLCSKISLLTVVTACYNIAKDEYFVQVLPFPKI